MKREDGQVSYRYELTGWLLFAGFVLGIWRLREWLNRTSLDG